MISLNNLINPSQQDKYKVVTKQVKLNQLVKDQFIPKHEELKRLNLQISKNNIRIRGVIKNPKEVKNIKKKHLSFDILLEKEDFSSHEIFFSVKEFKFYYPRVKIDFLKMLSKYSNIVKEKVLKSLTEEDSLNFMLKALMYALGTQYLSIEQINHHSDPLKFLIDISLGYTK